MRLIASGANALSPLAASTKPNLDGFAHQCVLAVVLFIGLAISLRALTRASLAKSSALIGLTTETNTLYNYAAYSYSSNVQRPNYNGGPVYTSESVASRGNDYFNFNSFSLPAPFTYGSRARLLSYLRASGALQLDCPCSKKSGFSNVCTYSLERKYSMC
ncbi:MAG TPA: hypothetical protein VHZ55_25505 [Bryobacteraceae bacterium]|jgi:hypothetical protein|nr:hypothetical protein [Bryobacteraceae bacterium]